MYLHFLISIIGDTLTVGEFRTPNGGWDVSSSSRMQQLPEISPLYVSHSSSSSHLPPCSRYYCIAPGEALSYSRPLAQNVSGFEGFYDLHLAFTVIPILIPARNMEYHNKSAVFQINSSLLTQWHRASRHLNWDSQALLGKYVRSGEHFSAYRKCS